MSQDKLGSPLKGQILIARHRDPEVTSADMANIRHRGWEVMNHPRVEGLQERASERARRSE